MTRTTAMGSAAAISFIDGFIANLERIRVAPAAAGLRRGRQR